MAIKMPKKAQESAPSPEEFIAGASDDFDWPDFDDETMASLASMAGRAAEHGALSSLSVPIPTPVDAGVGLNVYSERANAFDAAAQRLLTEFAVRSAVAVAMAPALAAASS